MQDDRKAELIEGVVVMSPPISADHGKSTNLLERLLGDYADATPHTACAGNVSVRLDGKNEYQPDVVLWIETGSLARMKAGSSGLLEGRPELVAEVALSTHAYDLHEKKAVYQRNLVQEYIVWEVMDARLHWFSLEDGEYVPLVSRQRDSAICSKVFPGLWLNARALLAGKNRADVFRTLNQGLKSAGHKAFVKKLANS